MLPPLTSAAPALSATFSSACSRGRGREWVRENVCVFVCVSERERERETDRTRDSNGIGGISVL